MLNRKINFFISVVEKGSFSAAAKQFFLSQSAISQQIVQLEKELGVTLFNRNGYRPVLTQAGKHYYQECNKLLRQYEKIEEDTKKIANVKQRSLQIGITGPMEIKFLPKIIYQYKKQYDDVSVAIKKINFETGMQMLESNELDISFGISNDFKDKEDIDAVKLMKHKVCIICSKEHEWAKRQFVSSSEIAGQPIISFSKSIGNAFYMDFLDAFKKDNIVPNIVQEYDELDEVILAVELNQGIAFTSREVISNEDNVCMLEIKHTHHHADFCIGYLKSCSKEHIEAFVEMTVEYFKANHYKNNL